MMYFSARYIYNTIHQTSHAEKPPTTSVTTTLTIFIKSQMQCPSRAVRPKSSGLRYYFGKHLSIIQNKPSDEVLTSTHSVVQLIMLFKPGSVRLLTMNVVQSAGKKLNRDPKPYLAARGRVSRCIVTRLLYTGGHNAGWSLSW